MKTYLLKLKNNQKNYIIVRYEDEDEIRGFVFSENIEFLGFRIIRKKDIASYNVCELPNELKSHVYKCSEPLIPLVENYFNTLFPLKNNKNNDKKPAKNNKSKK